MAAVNGEDTHGVTPKTESSKSVQTGFHSLLEMFSTPARGDPCYLGGLSFGSSVQSAHTHQYPNDRKVTQTYTRPL